MRKTEILKQLADSANKTKLADLGAQIGALHQAKLTSADELASILEPIAQAMAALTDETRQSLNAVEAKGMEQAERIQQQIMAAAQACQVATQRAESAAQRLETAGRTMEWRHYLLAISTACMTALLVSAFWLWLAPPTVSNYLDPKAVAEELRPAIAALKPSKGK
jgi:hypothetical protein